MAEIVVKYSCHGCGVADALCPVPARVGDQDIVAFMDETVCVVHLHHLRRFPGCVAVKVDDLMIPQSKSDPTRFGHA